MAPLKIFVNFICIGKDLFFYILHSNFLSAYSTFFITGLILSMQIPFVGFQPIKTSEHMASAGVAQLFNFLGIL